MPILMVYPDYFATIGMTFSSGRDFGQARHGRDSRLPVCIVNESFVRQVSPGPGSDREAVLHRPARAAVRSSPTSPPAAESASPSSASSRTRGTATREARSSRSST